MANKIPINWGATSALTTTNLDGVTAGQIWQSGEQNDSNPCNEFLEVFYKIRTANTMVAGDYINFFLAKGDQHASEIWDGGIGTTSDNEITSTSIIAGVEQSLNPIKVVTWKTNHGDTFYGHFVEFNFGPSWQVLVQPIGENLHGTGGESIIHYRYGVREVQ